MKIPANILLILLLILPLSAKPATKIIIYEAYIQGNVLNPKLVVAQRYTGNCWTRSLANNSRSDAWRCMTNNLIIDPCFQDGNSVACINTPWSNKVMILKLTTPLPQNSLNREINTRTAPPWALELANGQLCSFLTGASSVIDHQRVNYSCTSYNYNVIGDINKSSTNWKVSLYNYNKKSVEEISVVTAWF